MPRRKTELTNYWISYSDLMAGLLFVLLAIIVISNYHYKSKLEIIGENIDLRKDIAQELLRRYKEKNITSVKVDPTTGNVEILVETWFKWDDDKLLPQAKKTLDEVMPIYLDVLFNNDITRGKLDRILIEGHTSMESDTPDKYLYNMDLSERRAYAVGEYVIKKYARDYYVPLKNHLVTLGRSFADANHSNVHEDAYKDRKILIIYKLDYEEMMKDLTSKG